MDESTRIWGELREPLVQLATVGRATWVGKCHPLPGLLAWDAARFEHPSTPELAAALAPTWGEFARLGRDAVRAMGLEPGTRQARIAVLAALEEGGAEGLATRGDEVRRTMRLADATMRARAEALRGQLHAEVRRAVENARPRDLATYLASFVHDSIAEHATEVAKLVSAVAEQGYEDAAAWLADRPAISIGRFDAIRSDVCQSARFELAVRKLNQDLGVIAVGAIGLTFMAVASPWLGGAIVASAPVLALGQRRRELRAVRERARELGVRAVDRATDKQVHLLGRELEQLGRQWCDEVTALTAPRLAQASAVYRWVDAGRGREGLGDPVFASEVAFEGWCARVEAWLRGVPA